MLRDTLQHTGSFLKALGRKWPVPETPRLEETARQLTDQLGSGVERPLPSSDLSALAARLYELARVEAYDHIERRDWRRAPETFWFGKRPLAANAQFLAEYFRFLEERGNVRALLRLMTVFLRDYPIGAPGFEEVSRRIVAALQSRDETRLEPWRQRQQSLALFTPVEGPKRLARLCLESRQSIADTLKGLGLHPALSHGGFCRAAYLEMLHLLRIAILPWSASSMLPTLERLLAWSVDAGALRYADLRAPLANALLLPFGETPRPGEEVEAHVQRFLLRSLGDPRLSQGQWQGVDEAATRIMLRWLISSTLEDFFRILDQVALDHHWRYRRAFWRAYFNHGALDDAWVALGPNALDLARRIFPEGHSYAELERGDDRDQCVLFLRIGDLTIGEWSHNGRCRIWQVEDKRTPRLYNTVYQGNALKSSLSTAAQFAHQGSENGRWQDNVAEYIAHKTGIQVRRHQHMYQE